MSECQNCAALKRENARLRRHNERLKQAIRKLRDMFRFIKDACKKIMDLMDEQYLSKTSGVPRARWAWAKGMHMCAKAIANEAAKAEWQANNVLNQV